MADIKSVEHIGRFITVDSAAKRTGFSRSYVNYLVRVGTVYAVKFGGCLAVDMVTLDAYMALRRPTDDERSERG